MVIIIIYVFSSILKRTEKIDNFIILDGKYSLWDRRKGEKDG